MLCLRSIIKITVARFVVWNIACFEWNNTDLPDSWRFKHLAHHRKDALNTLSWICLRRLFTLCHGNSPLNYHLGIFLFRFRSILCKLLVFSLSPPCNIFRISFPSSRGADLSLSVFFSPPSLGRLCGTSPPWESMGKSKGCWTKKPPAMPYPPRDFGQN